MLLLLFGIGALFFGRRVVQQKFDLEKTLRAQVIPALEKQLGKKVEVGKIESDYFSRVVLRDVVIGRDNKSPLGALLQAKTVTLNLDIVNLVMHRDDPLQSISRVAVDTPQVDLRRDAQGRFNLSSLFKKKSGAPTIWHGVVEVRDGRVYYQDALLCSARGRDLVADSTGIKARLRFNGNDPIRYDAALPSTLVGQSKDPIRDTHGSGTMAPDGSWLVLAANCPRAPAPLLTEYAFRRGEVVAQGGQIGASIHLMWDTALPPQAQFAVQGRAILVNVSGYAQALKEPGTTKPLLLRGGTGEVRFSDKSFQTPGLTVTALGTPLHGSGSFTFLPTPSFDASLSLDGLNADRLLAMARQLPAAGSAPTAALLKNLQLRTGVLRGQVRLTGNIANWTATGKAGLPGLALSHPQWGQWNAASPSSDFSVQSVNGKMAVRAAVRVTSASGRQVQAGAWQAGGSCAAEIAWDNRTIPSPLQVKFSAGAFEGSQKQLGSWRGSGVAGLVRWNGVTGQMPAVRLSVQKLAGRHPGTGVLGARSLLATVNWQGQRFAIAATAGSALGDSPRLGHFQSGLVKLGAQGTFQAGSASIDASSARGNARQWGLGRFERLQVLAGWQGTELRARWNARGASIQNAQAGAWRAGSVRGAGNMRSLKNAMPVSLDAEARDFAGGQSRYGFWKGAAVRVVASTSNAGKAGWSGVAAAGDIDTRRANLAAISPSVAQQVRGVGLVTGKARFTGLMTSSPVVKGRARLTEATLLQNGEAVTLHDIETAVTFGDERLRLTGMRAQSPYGPVQGEAQSELKTGRLRFAILAPRVALSQAELNRYLKTTGLSIEGNATARLRLSAGGNSVLPKAGAKKVSATISTQVRVQFEVALPKGRARWLDTRTKTATPVAVRAQDARLRGEGLMRFNDAEHWSFAGDLAFAAAHIANEAEAGAQEIVRGSGLEVTGHGTLARSGAAITPQLVGELHSRTLLLPLAGQSPLPLEQTNAEFIVTKDEWQLPRFTAQSGESKLTGHARLQDVNSPESGFSGQVLLEKFDAARARQLLVAMQSDGSDSAQLPEVLGTLYARADFTGSLRGARLERLDMGVQSRLYSGLTRWHDANGQLNVLPIDAARLATSLTLPRAQNAPISIDNLSIWTDGARLSAQGDITPQGADYALDLDATLHTLRLRHLLVLPMLRAPLQKLADESGFEGLLSGQFKITGTASAPAAKGRAALRMAQAFGFDIETATGDMEARPAQAEDGTPTFFIAMHDLQGRFADGEAIHNVADDERSLKGEFIADGAANAWSLSLHTQHVSTNYLLLAAAQTSAAQTQGWKDIPLAGSLRAGVELKGTLRDDDGKAHFMPRSGTVEIASGEGADRLRWAGRDLGVLTAKLQLQNGVLQAREFTLVRQQGASTVGPGESSPSLFEVKGALPVTLDTPDLEAQIIVKNQPLSFGLQALREIRDSLDKRGQNVAYLDTILHRIDALPPSIDGRFDMEAQLEQSWRMPVLAVSSLTVSDTYFRTPSGTRRTLPNLRTSFVYDSNDRGAVSIRNAELRLPRTKKEPPPGSDAASEDDDEDDDLLIRTLKPGRIVPGGELSLQAEILNADLEQLADWLPVLREVDGRPALRGRLSDFVVQLAGTTDAPEVTGSLLGEDWEFRNYTLDRVRLDRFTIKNGEFRVDPGYLTVVKGEFQSAAAWGTLPWTWGEDGAAPGPDYNKPVEVHFPVGKENFGALAGVFVPVMENVGADDFQGEVTLGGTLNALKLTGQATITNGTFRLRPVYSEMDAGVANLTGTVRFLDGNHLEIAPGGLRGKLVPASAVEAPATGNQPSEAREERDEKRKRENKNTAAPRLAGDFLVEGGITFNLDPASWFQPQRTFSSHRYDLRLALKGGNYSTADFSGVRDAQGVLLWKTGAGDPRSSQQVRWAFTASGDNSGKEKEKERGGRLSSVASLQLAPNFAESLDALLRATAQPFNDAGEFEAIMTDVSSAAGTTEADGWTQLRELIEQSKGQPSRISLNEFRFSWKNVARGAMQGSILIDNGTSTRQPPSIPFENPPSKSPLQPASIELVDGSDAGPPPNSPIQGAVEGTAPPAATTPPATTTPRRSGGRGTRGGRNNSRGADSGERAPLRLSGELTLQEAELYGAPAESKEKTPGVADILSAGFAMPEAPVFDMQIHAGRNVQFVSSNLRATITGDLEASGTPRDPVVYGTLYTRGGQITFPNARARLVSGELTVAARRDPVSGALRLRVEIDATARGRSGRYDITLRLRGPLDTGENSTQDLRVDVSSDPPLSQDEAFSQLLGTAVLNRGSLDGEQNENYARALVGLFSGPLFSGLERSLERVLGLDSIALDYRVDEPIGVEIGKAIGDRFYISYRRALQSAPGQKTPFDLRIEYRIKGDIELGLEKDESNVGRITIQKRWRF